MNLPLHSIKKTTTWVGLVITFSLLASYPTNGLSQSLESVTKSEAYFAIQSDVDNSNKPRKGEKQKFATPYESLFENKNSPNKLLQWLGCRLPDWNASVVSSTLKTEVAWAQITFKNKKGVRVNLLVQVPRPELQLLAKNSVLMSFKRLQPPFVTVIASHTVNIAGISANYSRLDDGSCTLHVPINKNGLAHFQTKKCTDSSSMIALAKQLTFDRLNGKLEQ